VNVTYCT